MDVAKIGAATAIASSNVKTQATSLTNSLLIVNHEMISSLILHAARETDTILHQS